MITIQNFGANKYSGWVRMNTDRTFPFPRGITKEGYKFVVGSKTGEDTRSLDVYVPSIAANSTTHLSLSEAVEDRTEPPEMEIEHLTKGLFLNGKAMQMSNASFDGAALVAHFKDRVGKTLHVDVWLRYYPEQKWIVFGECLVTCSDSTSEELFDNPSNLELKLEGSFLVHLDGTISDNLGLPNRLADGQAVGLPISFVFNKELKDADQWNSVIAIANKTVNAVAIDKLWADGSPDYEYRSLANARNRYQEAMRRLKTLDAPTFGIAKQSGVTGAQADQIFVYGEARLNPECTLVAYLDACKWANRPCHHLEHDGSVVSIDNHPDLKLWDGRVHWHSGVSPDRLGKTTQVQSHEVPGGWWGPDVEHWMFNTLMVAKRMTGSPMLDKLLEHQAEVYRLQFTLQPGASTSQTYASRATGYEGIAAVHLVKNSSKESVRDNVRGHWNKRVEEIIIPHYKDKLEWDARIDDRLGLGQGVEGWMPWQSSLGCYGLDYACRNIGPDSGIEIALKQAELCVRRDWVKLEGESHFRNVGNQITSEQDPPQSYYQGLDWPSIVTWFRTTWAVPALRVVLHHDPMNEKAKAVWEDIKYDVDPSWMPPVV